MDIQIGDTWYGRHETAYEGIQATIHDITTRYVQVSFHPPLYAEISPLLGKPLGKRQFRQNFSPRPPHYQVTIFDI